MRLHHLTVTAFGPFAGTERVDFDELNDAGLFLLTGPTGAGKSSLLDAVCFALYGVVPGVREVRTLRSQHAPSDVAPEVVLDFSVQGRRFVVRRSPEWTRAKRRGTGTTTEKASASIIETTDGEERFLSSRAAEVGLLVGGLMGMSAGQFTQVALLPQGEFQTFLRASSQERHDVLQQLFRTDRFTRIEEWVGDHSRQLRDEAETGRSSVQRLVDTLADRAGLTAPEELCGDGLPVAAAEGRASAWAGDVLASTEAEAEVARAQHAAASADLGAARARLEVATRLAELRTRRDGALGTLASLAAARDEADQARTRLDDHTRAVRCAPVRELHADAVAEAEAAARALDAAVIALRSTPSAAVPDLPGAEGLEVPDGLTPGDLSALVDAGRDRVALLQALLPRERAAAGARTARDADRAALVAAEQRLVAAADRGVRLPGDLLEAEESLHAATARASRHDSLALAADAARSAHQAAVALGPVRALLRLREDARRDARDRAQDDREALQTLVGRRLAGMAAELAGQLQDGCACQVCGSTDHPRKAVPAHDAVTDEDHRAADARLAAATAALQAAEEAVAEVQRRHDALTAASGGLDVAGLAERLAGLEADVADADAARARQESLQERVRALRVEQLTVSEEQAAAAAAAAGLREAVAAHQRTLDALEAEVADALGGTGARSVTATAAACARWTDRVAAVRDARLEHDRAADRLAATALRADATAREHGFSGLEAVAAAVLDQGDHARLASLLREREATEARARAVLDDPALAELERPDPELPDPELSDPAFPADPARVASAEAHLGRLLADCATAESAAAGSAGVAALHEDRVRAVHGLRTRLIEALECWAPVRDRSLRAESIARLVKGRGHDNQLQMRLSAYVLATRLDQVVAAANERLAHMRDQRYVLQRTGRAERRGSQAGLGLEVVDQWTGDARPPSSLSGGETFVVSLSLALGLADVVTHETGGTEIETLFVDEGFGSLDADTLDDVIDRLDGLRAGGRTVGVVSHVTELRDRIPTQVQVHKTRNGSTVAVRTLVG